MQTATSSITEAVVDFAQHVRFESLPSEVIEETKRVLLDAVGCAFLGAGVDKGRIAAALALELGGTPECTIIGYPTKVSSANAAFANGELINAADFDVANTAGHVPPWVLGAVLALAESRRSSGKELIAALAIGLEFGHRLGKALTEQRELVREGDRVKYVWSAASGFSSATLGAALGASKVLGLDREKMHSALELAGYLTPVPTVVKWRTTCPSSMTKYGSAGWGAQAALTASLLAGMGYVGDATVLDGEYGFWRFYGSQR